MPEWGQASGTCPGSRHRHQPALLSTRPLTARTLVSHACPAILHPQPRGTSSAPTPRLPPAGLPPTAHPDRVSFDKLIQVLVLGCGSRRIDDATRSATTLRRRREEWITLGLAEQLHLLVLSADDRMLGLQLDTMAVDGCITKAPAAANSPVAAPSTVANRA